MAKKTNFSEFSVFLQKVFRRFTNYTKHQKTFVLFLLVFAVAVVLFPLLRITPTEGSSYALWIWSPAYFKSCIIMLISLAFLFGWNMNINFKAFMVKCFGFRESEPILNFLFLWMIISLYMPMLDTILAASNQTGTLSVHWGLWLQLLLLLVGLGISLVEVRKSASQNSQKTKILNIVDEEAPQSREEPKRIVPHLFDDELE